MQSVNGTIVECNTAYDGQRNTTEAHLKVVKDHGFLDIAPFCLQDENGSMTLPVNGGEVIKEIIVEQEHVDVDVSTHGMDEVVAADGEAVTVARDLPYCKLGA